MVKGKGGTRAAQGVPKDRNAQQEPRRPRQRGKVKHGQRANAQSRANERHQLAKGTPIEGLALALCATRGHAARWRVRRRF
eukprot:5077399-Pleurochrysis_carterae.AAC.2